MQSMGKQIVLPVSDMLMNRFHLDGFRSAAGSCIPIGYAQEKARIARRRIMPRGRHIGCQRHGSVKKL